MSVSSHPSVAVVGGGPAGLMAAEALAAGGCAVDVYDAMPSPGRKFLMAGKGGLNITHAEAFPDSLARYGDAAPTLAPWLRDFAAPQLRDWMTGLGIASFVGTSGRVFPTEMKAAPLLRAWLHRLRGTGVRLHVRHRWLGWDDAGRLRFATPAGEVAVDAAATVLALGGGSWPQLGSDGSWQALLAARGIDVAPLQASNCGWDVAGGWSAHLRERHAGAPLKSAALAWDGIDGQPRSRRGDLTLTASGLEGGALYAAGADLRAQLAAQGHAEIRIDLAPDRDAARVAGELAQPRGRDSLANHLRRRLHLDGARAALLFEASTPAQRADAVLLAPLVKALPLRLTAPRPLAEAISSAGGVRLAELDARLMLRRLPGVFCAGEMLDWDAPTGGYLLTACFATGLAAGRGALAWIAPR